MDRKHGREYTPLLYLALFILLATVILHYESTPKGRDKPSFLTRLITGCQQADAAVMYLAYATAVLLAAEACLPQEKRKRLRTAVYAVLALIAAASAFSYFYFEKAACSPTFVQVWDTYHYALGAKYAAELGYTRLYECTLLASKELDRRIPNLKYVRDLESYKLVDYKRALKETACSMYFTGERWAEFKDDVTLFFDARPPMWPDVLQDHGYHGTPVYTAIAGLILDVFSLSYLSLLALSLLDIAALFLMFAYVTKTFGWRTGFLFTILFCVNYPGRFLPIGGSLLRYLWMPLLVVGVCRIRGKKYASAGVLLACSSMLQVFPALFVGGVGLKAARDFVKKRAVHRDYIRFFTAFAATSVILLIASASLGHGLESWSGFKKQMDLNAYRFSQHRIGFKYVFMSDLAPERIMGSRDFEAVKPAYYAATFILLALAAAASLRLDDVEATVLFGFALLFSLTVTVTYYYAVASMLALLWHRRIKDTWGTAMVVLLVIFMGSIFTASGIILHERVFSDNEWSLNQALVYNVFSSWVFAAYLAATLAFFLCQTVFGSPRLGVRRVEPPAGKTPLRRS